MSSTSLSRLANRYIATSKREKTVVFRQGDLDDIIQTIMEADRRSEGFTTKFAPFLRGNTDRRTLRNVWAFIRKHIRYQKDRPNDEIIKSPGATWMDGYGDCKSFSVMSGSLLRDLGFDYKYRVVFYDEDYPEQGHIYPVVVLADGEEVIVDSVYHSFDQELAFWKGYDYDASTGKRKRIASISGYNMSQNWIWWALLGLFLVKPILVKDD